MNGGGADAPPKLHEAAEDLLRVLLYCPDDEEGTTPANTTSGGGSATAVPHRRCNRFGLQSPLWYWAHRSARTQQDCVVTETTMCVHLARWFGACGVDLKRVVIVANRLTAAAIRERIASAPPHDQQRLERIHVDVFDAAAAPAGAAPTAAPHNGGKVVLLALGLKSTVAHGKLMALCETSVSRWLCVRKPPATPPAAVIVVGDAGWSVNSFWPNMAMLISKFKQEKCRASGTRDDSLSYSSIFHSRLPVCCPRHPNERALVSGIDRISGFCTRLCLHPFSCGVAGHVCLEKCHPAEEHVSCVYSCRKTLPCGHECVMSCSAPCDCAHEVIKPLPCSHEVVTHLDEELQPVFATVQHVFRGPCASVGDVCCAAVPVLCAKCGGKFEERCHVVRAAGHGYAEEARTLTCATCATRMRKIRSECRVELQREAEAKMKEYKARVKDELYEQRKAAAQKIFQAGQKVVILDHSKVTDPLTPEDDFPGIIFCPSEDVPQRAHGVVVEAAADITDLSEFQYCVRLPSGRCALVYGSGLQLVRAAAVRDVARGGGGEGAGVAPLLLLNGAPPQQQQPEHGGPASSGGVSRAHAGAAAPAVGTLCLLTQPIPLPSATSGSPGELANVVVEVCGEPFVKSASARPPLSTWAGEGPDEAHPQTTGLGVSEDAETSDVDGVEQQLVRVRCVITEFDHGGMSDAPVVDGADAPAKAARREEVGGAEPLLGGAAGFWPQTIAAVLPRVVEVDAPLGALEVVPQIGAHVLAQPSGTIVHPRERSIINAALGAAAAVDSGVAEGIARERDSSETGAGAGSAAAEVARGLLRGCCGATVASHPISVDEPAVVAGLVNVPGCSLGDHGPVFILQLKRQAAPRAALGAMAAGAGGRGGHGRFTRPPPPSSSSAAQQRFIGAPAVFVALDDEIAAEATLGAEMLERLEELFDERFARDVSERKVVNDELLFVEQERLTRNVRSATTTTSSQQQQEGKQQDKRVAYSTPRPLLSEHELAKRKAALAHLQVHNDTRVKLAVKKEALLARRDPAKHDRDFWSSVAPLLETESEAIGLWVASVRRELVASTGHGGVGGPSNFTGRR